MGERSGHDGSKEDAGQRHAKEWNEPRRRRRGHHPRARRSIPATLAPDASGLRSAGHSRAGTEGEHFAMTRGRPSSFSVVAGAVGVSLLIVPMLGEHGMTLGLALALACLFSPR